MSRRRRCDADSARILISVTATFGISRTSTSFTGTTRTNLRATKPNGFFNGCAPADCARTFRRLIPIWAGKFFARTFLTGQPASAIPTTTLIMKNKSNQTTNSSQHNLNRRQFLGKAVKGVTLTALFAGLPKGWLGTAYASDAPETAAVKFGMIALTDCSPIVIAHEKGLFKKYGINSSVSKRANWAAIPDNLRSGAIQATHMHLGMPIAP